MGIHITHSSIQFLIYFSFYLHCYEICFTLVRNPDTNGIIQIELIVDSTYTPGSGDPPPDPIPCPVSIDGLKRRLRNTKQRSSDLRDWGVMLLSYIKS
jgi:hypothetical protein